MADIQIAGIELVTFELDRALAFYVEGLGFTPKGVTTDRGDAVALLSFGKTLLRLRSPVPRGTPYPRPMSANDPWFQHFAIAVSDPAAACERVLSAGGLPISERGPVPLPPSSGAVTAWKFRDPDGHPLELSAYPDDYRARGTGNDPLFLRVDHTAVAVSDLEKSVAFYVKLGFRERTRGLNQGATQARLDGLRDPMVGIVVLEGKAEPHLELLHYRTPTPPPPQGIADLDVAATRTLLSGLSAAMRDPDGHRIEPAQNNSSRP
jgi:catechol 2,3-dioxygenase-like lactoylglutathione lyase family enzyme